MSFTRVTQKKCAPCFSNGFVSRNVCSLLSPPQHPNTAEDVEVQVWVATVETPIKIVCVFWALNWFLILDCHHQALSPSVAATYCNHFCHLLLVSLKGKKGISPFSHLDYDGVKGLSSYFILLLILEEFWFLGFFLLKDRLQPFKNIILGYIWFATKFPLWNMLSNWLKKRQI